MSHLKKDFKFHNYFDNKFSEQTYLAYLCRDNKRYVNRIKSLCNEMKGYYSQFQKLNYILGINFNQDRTN